LSIERGYNNKTEKIILRNLIRGDKAVIANATQEMKSKITKKNLMSSNLFNSNLVKAIATLLASW
jgi:hypothetical protein